MRSKRSWAWAGLGASSLLAFLAACGSVNETFTINVNTLDAGSDSGPAPTDATVADGSTPDATSDATVADSSVQDAQVDAGVDAGSGPVVPDGGSVVMVGDAAVVIPPFDPGQLGIDAGALVGPDGGAPSPRQIRDVVNTALCSALASCCCAGGCTTPAELDQVVDRSRCVSELGENGFGRALEGNELTGPLPRFDQAALTSCLAIIGGYARSCNAIPSATVVAMRRICTSIFTGVGGAGTVCTSAASCQPDLRCVTSDAGLKTCVQLAATDEPCATSYDCSNRNGITAQPALYCESTDAGKKCSPALSSGAQTRNSTACGESVYSFGAGGCIGTLPFADLTAANSLCRTFAPRDQ